MKTIQIQVEDSDFESTINILKQLKPVQAINIDFEATRAVLERVQIAQVSERDEDQICTHLKDVIADDEIININKTKHSSQSTDQVNEITMMSQDSLAEDWLSESDNYYDNLFAEYDSVNNVTEKNSVNE